MMAASPSSSNLISDHLVQDDLPWPASSSSSLPFAPAAHPHHSTIIGGNQQWWQQPQTLNCADRHHSDELEVLLSAQGSHHHHPSSPVIPPQLSSLLMMQDLGFQWSSCGSFVDTSSPMPPLVNGQQHDDGHNKIKEWDRPLTANSSRSSCASTATACRDAILDGGGGGLPAMAAVAADLDGTVLPTSVNVPRTTTTCQRPFPAAPPPLPGDALEILASSRLCKTLLLSQASSSVLLHNGTTMPLLRSEHVPYGPPPAAHPQGPSIGNYKECMQMGASCLGGAAGGGRAQHEAACQSMAAAAARPVPSSKKPRVEQRSSTIVPSFKVRKEKLGDRIAALQQLVSPFGKTDTASVLMEAIGYIKFLQDQVETLSRPYSKSSRSKKPRPTPRGSSNANAGELEETRPDLRSRGLCLVPLSCTSYVTNENGVWVPPNFRAN